MEKVWYQDHFPVGMTISGETLKEFVEKEFFDIGFASVNGSMIRAEEANFSDVDDKEVWIIGLNTNSNTIMFIQLFTENRVVIETTTKPEVKEAPYFHFNHAL